MKRISLLLLGLGLFGLAGCSSPIDFIRGPGDEMKTGVSEITVTSEPPGADIYLNDKFVGRTPSASLGFSYQYVCWRQPLGLGHTGGSPAETYTIKVSKNGYKDAVETIEFDSSASTPFNAACYPKKGVYHFILEPNSPTVQGGSSTEISKAQEIEKYKELMDKGIITKEEFEQKKKQLLGL